VTRLDVDVAIVGSGFGGSLAALLLAQIGRSCALVDRSSHPRFAIGESSTPNADLALLAIARAYDLPQLAPLAKYGTWQETYPHIVCGLKRGFSYFHHQPGHPIRPTSDHVNELLVTASPDDARSDTHWLRSDVDHFFADEAMRAGVPLFENTIVALGPHRDGWRLTATSRPEPLEIDARFVIDGTGEFGLIPRTLGISSRVDTLATNSRTVFAHFRDLRPWDEIMRAAGATSADHPFNCDHAAVHQVIDEGWMYQLRFNNGVTSAGFVLDAEQCPLNESISIEAEWKQLLGRYPSLAEQFHPTTVVGPPGGLARTRRLQRRLSRGAGENWALLPHTFGFIDPLHSTGIAQSLRGIERLVVILRNHWQKPTLAAALARYANTLDREIELIDKLVSGCYLTRRNFRLFIAFAMLYFAATTVSEHRRAMSLAGNTAEHPFDIDSAFLLADDPRFLRVVNEAWQRARDLASQPNASAAEIASFEGLVAAGIQPYNIAGLCDPSVANMYRYTAAQKPEAANVDVNLQQFARIP
jgi:tetracycline 7-halogenase / FADH2 O2-dependent halogenase